MENTEVYFADGPMQGKFIIVNAWPFRTVRAHTFELSYLHQRNPYDFVEWEEVIYDKFTTLMDTDGRVLRIAYLGPKPRIKDLLMRD